MHLLITGTSTGIGRSLAEHLAARGHQVWGLARSDQSARVAQLAGGAGGFCATRCDVADWPQVAAAAQAVAAVWPALDGIICCAGLQGAIGPAVTADPPQWSATVRANLDGTYYAIRAFHELLRRAPRRGKIICFSGGGATKPRPNFSAYGVAKTGIVRLVETLAEELREQPVDVNAVAPGPIHTRLTDEVVALGPAVVGETEYQAALKQTAAGGADMRKVTGLVEFLLSPASDGISGRLLSAPWDPWPELGGQVAALAQSDLYTLRRIVPADRPGWPG